MRAAMVVVLIGLFMVGTCQMALADKWQAYRFKGDERFEYKVVWEWEEDEEKMEGTYILDTPKSVADIFGGTYIAKGTSTKEESVKGICVAGVLLHNVLLPFLDQPDLQVGKQVSFPHREDIKIKVIGKEKIAGREGLVCQIFQTKDGKEELVAEYLIDPKLAMPLRSKVFEKTKVQGQMELIKYTRY